MAQAGSRHEGWLRCAVSRAAPFLTVLAAWEAIARVGPFPRGLFPPLAVVGSALLQSIASGLLWGSALGSLQRLLVGFLMAATVGLSIGILMGRYRLAEDVLMPAVSTGLAIPGVAYAPLFVLWFGLGDLPAILLVGLASSFTIIVNTAKGVQAVRDILIRAALSLGTSERQMFYKVILPGALPDILTALRLGLAQAWRNLVAIEMLTAVTHGLGSMIFTAQQFLNTGLMLTGVAFIALLGALLEKQVFVRLERAPSCIGECFPMTESDTADRRRDLWFPESAA